MIYPVPLMIVLILLASALLAAQPVAAARKITVTFSSFPLPSSSDAHAITRGSDGALWFTTPAKLGRITLSGSVLEFAIPLPYFDAAYITTGPDNALWVTGYTDHRIVRAMPSG